MVKDYVTIRQSPGKFKKIFNKGKLLHRVVAKILNEEWIFSAYSYRKLYYITFGSKPDNQCLYEYGGYKNSEAFLKEEWDGFTKPEIVGLDLSIEDGVDISELPYEEKIGVMALMRFSDRGWCFKYELLAQIEQLRHSYERLKSDKPISVDDDGIFIDLDAD